MGFGLFPLGARSGFGADPVYVPAPAAPPVLPRAMMYDPRLRQFVLHDVNGNLIDVHPVDQIVAVRLTTLVNQSASEPDLGTRFKSIVAGTNNTQAQQQATAEVNRVLADLIANGDVQVISVSADTTSVYGRASFAVTYYNLRLRPSANRYPTTANTVTATTGGV